MAKIDFDKYYTPPIVAKWCINRCWEVIPKDSITEIIEPAAGAGSFSHQLEGCKAYDISPQHEYIEQADFFKLELNYKEGRLMIGNPPFGTANNGLLKRWLKQTHQWAEYSAYILTPRFYNNYEAFDGAELIDTTIIKTYYSNQALYTAFNIYKTHPDKKKWKREYKTDKWTVIAFNKAKEVKSNITEIPDVSFIGWGNIFKLSKPWKGANTYGIYIHDARYKDKVKRLITSLHSWEQDHKYFHKTSISTPGLSTNSIHRILRTAFPEAYEEVKNNE